MLSVKRPAAAGGGGGTRLPRNPSTVPQPQGQREARAIVPRLLVEGAAAQLQKNVPIAGKVVGVPFDFVLFEIAQRKIPKRK